MMDEIKKLFLERNTFSHTNQGIFIAKVSDSSAGLVLAEEVLQLIVNSHTLLLLSGGRTPKELYTALAKQERIDPGAVGMIDERFGQKWHENSNETMFRETGLLRYLEMRGIPFYPVLTQTNERAEVAREYEMILRDLQFQYQQTIGVLGIGVDGHTAGIPADSKRLKITSESLESSDMLVAEYNDGTGPYGERVTMTFLGLQHLDFFIVLVFGDDKKDALEAVFSSGTEEAIPGRFFTRPEIAKRTLFITDQKV